MTAGFKQIQSLEHHDNNFQKQRWNQLTEDTVFQSEIMPITWFPTEAEAKSIRIEYNLNKTHQNQKFQEKKELGQRNKGNGEQTQTQKISREQVTVGFLEIYFMRKRRIGWLYVIKKHMYNWKYNFTNHFLI